MRIGKLFYMVLGIALMLSSDVCASAQTPEETARQQARDEVRSKLNLRAGQFLDIHRDEVLEQSLALTAGRQIGAKFIYRLSSEGNEIKEKTIVQHLSTDGDFIYIIAVNAADGSAYRIHGFPDSLAEFEKLIKEVRLTVLRSDQAEVNSASPEGPPSPE